MAANRLAFVSHFVAELTKRVLLSNTHALEMFEGRLLAWRYAADISAAGLAGSMAVTAGMDDVVFPHPCKPGDRANMFTLVTSAGPTLMKVETISDGEIIQQRISLACVYQDATVVAR